MAFLILNSSFEIRNSKFEIRNSETSTSFSPRTSNLMSRKQDRLFLFLLHKIRDANSREPESSFFRKIEFLQQLDADARQIVAAGGREVGRVAAGGGLESAGA